MLCIVIMLEAILHDIIVEGRLDNLHVFFLALAILLSITCYTGILNSQEEEERPPEFLKTEVTFEDAIKSLENMGYKIYLREGDVNVSN